MKAGSGITVKFTPKLSCKIAQMCSTVGKALCSFRLHTNYVNCVVYLLVHCLAILSCSLLDKHQVAMFSVRDYVELESA